MAYCGMKKEDMEDTSMERHWKSARPAPAWNPFGQLPAPQRGQGGEGDERAEDDERGEQESVQLTPRAPPFTNLFRKLQTAHAACYL